MSPYNIPSQNSLLIYLFLFKEPQGFALLPFILPYKKKKTKQLTKIHKSNIFISRGRFLPRFGPSFWKKLRYLGGLPAFPNPSTPSLASLMEIWTIVVCYGLSKVKTKSSLGFYAIPDPTWNYLCFKRY